MYVIPKREKGNEQVVTANHHNPVPRACIIIPEAMQTKWFLMKYIYSYTIYVPV